MTKKKVAVVIEQWQAVYWAYWRWEKGATFSSYYALFFKKGKNVTEAPKEIVAVYGEDAVTDQKCQKCFAKFCPRDTSLDNGRPVAVDSDQIETLIENSQRYTMLE